MQRAISQTLNRLETALNLETYGSNYNRLRAIAQQVLTQIEREYDTYSPTKN